MNGKKIKIYVLANDEAYSEDFEAEHGLSLYIETPEHNILFDTGASSVFARNAERMGVDLKKADIAFISHGHYDHGGGMKRFLEINPSAPVYISRYAFGDFYNAKGKFIGIDKNMRGSKRLKTVEKDTVIDGEISVFPADDKYSVFPIDSAGLTEKRSEKYLPDRFLHEQYLLINTGGRRILISGCSHRGILNITERFRPDIIIGGFHFMNQKIENGPNAVLDDAARRLLKYDTKYYTCHCTGKTQYEYLKTRMGEKLDYIAAGQIITV